MTELAAYTEGDALDVALCKIVGETLQRAYPGYPWMVGMQDHQAGVLVIDLPYKPPSLRSYAYLLYARHACDEKAVRAAGGEWLERIGLARERATQWAEERAAENGLDLGNIVTKSKA